MSEPPTNRPDAVGDGSDDQPDPTKSRDEKIEIAKAEADRREATGDRRGVSSSTTAVVDADAPKGDDKGGHEAARSYRQYSVLKAISDCLDSRGPGAVTHRESGCSQP